MDFAEHDEKIFAGSGRKIGRRLPRLSSPRALQGEDVGGGDRKGIEDVASRKEKQGVEKLKPLEDRPRPEEDQFEKEVLVGKGIAEIEHHPGRRGEHACEEGSHLKDLPNHDVRLSKQRSGCRVPSWVPFESFAPAGVRRHVRNSIARGGYTSLKSLRHGSLPASEWTQAA